MPPRAQHVLDAAFAWSVINRHFDVADFLLERGADINTTWSSHEPASILHELVFHENYESMRFLIDRGIDMTITDYRWNSTARGWALYGKNDPPNGRMAVGGGTAAGKRDERRTQAGGVTAGMSPARGLRHRRGHGAPPAWSSRDASSPRNATPAPRASRTASRRSP